MSEQVHTINISKAKRTDRPKVARKAMNMIKDYIQRHTGAMPLIGKELNREIWKGGGKKVPTTVKITTIVEDGYAKSELFGHKFSEKTKEEISKERKEKPKKAEKHDHDHHEKKDGTEKVPEEVKKDHAQDAKVEDKKATTEAKKDKIEQETKRQTENIEANQPKS